MKNYANQTLAPWQSSVHSNFLGNREACLNDTITIVISRNLILDEERDILQWISHTKLPGFLFTTRVYALEAEQSSNCGHYFFLFDSWVLLLPTYKTFDLMRWLKLFHTSDHFVELALKTTGFKAKVEDTIYSLIFMACLKHACNERDMSRSY